MKEYQVKITDSALRDMEQRKAGPALEAASYKPQCPQPFRQKDTQEALGVFAGKFGGAGSDRLKYIEKAARSMTGWKESIRVTKYRSTSNMCQTAV